MTKFTITAASDFGISTMNEHVRQALHKSQTNLKSGKPEQSALRSAGIKNTVEFELPGLTVAEDDLMEWILDSMRNNYGGPPFVLALTMLPDDHEVIAEEAALE